MIWCILICATAYAIKGGWHGPLRNRIKNPIIHRLLDGKIVSAVMFAVLVLAIEGTALSAVLAAAGWLLMVAPSIGDPIGQAGGYRGNWDDDEIAYPSHQRRQYFLRGLKSGVIRHVYGTAMLALFLGYLPFIAAGAVIPALYWAGISIEQFRTKQTVASWHLAEPSVGAWIGFVLFIITGGTP